MFSLVVTIISIALVAALTLATLYYGGDSFNKGDASARAAQVVLQGQQVLGAADLFKADNGRWPDSMQELVDGKYLKQVPYVSKQTIARNEFDSSVVASAHAQAEAVSWVMPVAGKPTFVLESAVAPEVCKQVNVKSRGDNGILRKASVTLATQCFGSDSSALTVVVTRELQSLTSAFAADRVTTQGIPLQGGVPDVTSSDWLVAPGAGDGSGAGGGTGGGGSGSGSTTPPPNSGALVGGYIGIYAGQGPQPVDGYFSASFDMSMNGDATRIIDAYYGSGEVPTLLLNGTPLVQKNVSSEWVTFRTEDFNTNVTVYWSSYGYGLGRPMSGGQFYVEMNGSSTAFFQNLSFEWKLDGKRAAYVQLKTSTTCDMTQFGYGSVGKSLGYEIVSAEWVSEEPNAKCITTAQ